MTRAHNTPDCVLTVIPIASPNQSSRVSKKPIFGKAKTVDFLLENHYSSEDIKIKNIRKVLNFKDGVFNEELSKSVLHQHVYLIRGREFINSNENTYKIGRSGNICGRVKNYPKDSEMIGLF